MARPEFCRRLIVNADDFGRSAPINHAVIRAHREGILTTASLMVNEPGFAEAVALAKENPRLGVGLHLTLLRGHAASPPSDIPGLVDAHGRFSDHPLGVGLRYFFARSVQAQLAAEIAAQFGKFHATGLKLDHVNGHLHLHLHPAVFRILTHPAADYRFDRLRLTRDPFWLNARLASGRWCYRLAHSLVFGLLAWRARGTLRRLGIRHSAQVFGLLQDGRVDEEYVLRLLSFLPPGDSELYSHPALDEFTREFEALISHRVRARVEEMGIELIRYQDL